MNGGPAMTDTSGTEGAQHGIDIITAVCVEQYSIYCTGAYKNPGMFLVTIKIYKFLSVFMCFLQTIQ